MEWVACAALDVGLLILEVVVNLWLALNLKDHGLLAEYGGIAVLVVLPTIVNPLVWILGIRKSFLNLDSRHIFLCVFLGFPSPTFVYIWHLYLSIFDEYKKAQESRYVANAFRIVQATVMSVPLLILNVQTLVGSLKAVNDQGQGALDITLLQTHLEEVKIHGVAFFLSFANILRASCSFNERNSLTLLFVLVGFPFVFFSVISRILGVSIIVTFLHSEWTCLLAFVLLFVNLFLYIVTRKREKRPKCIEQRKDDDEIVKDPFRDERRETSRTMELFKSLPQLLLLSICSIIIPTSYSNDRLHPKIKGGLFILLNYLLNMGLIALVLGVTIFYFTPNDIQGFSVPNPSVQVEVPGSKVFVQVGGMDVALNLPNTNVDLGSMPAFTANLNTDNIDLMFAIITSVLLMLLPLPFVVMRAAMMELDCFIVRKKEFDNNAVEIRMTETKAVIGRAHGIGGSSGGHYGVNGVGNALNRKYESLKRNSQSIEIKSRLYLAICCSFGGMCIFTVTLLVSGALIVVQLH